MHVYVSNAEDGDIGFYRLRDDGSLAEGGRAPAARILGPMSVSPDRRFLAAAVRSKPFRALSYAIDHASGALEPLGEGPLAESLPYITFDRTGRFLLGASYSANLVSVNPVDGEGRVGEPLQVIPTARNAHAIITDRANRNVYVPHLGTDQLFQFTFDEKSGRLSANTPPLVQLAAGCGPRHIIVSNDDRFAYLLNELTATITAFAIQGDGTLKALDTTSFLPPDSKLGPGLPRPQQGRDVSNDIWASDLHLTPDGRFLYAAERTTSTINAMSVDASGKLKYLASTPTEKQPRGFRIDPSGRFLVASGELSGTISSYAIEANGTLRLVGRYPTGKGSNWVEIV